MYKTIYILLIFLLMSGCKLHSFWKHLSEQEFITHHNIPQAFELGNDNKIRINVSLNGHNHIMFFDTRATSALFINDDGRADTLPEINAPKFMNPKVATGQRINSKFIRIQTAECKIFTAKNWIIQTIKHPKQDCDSFIGIVGHDDFSLGTKKQTEILKIDFDKQEIMLINKVPKNWIKIKSKFNLGYIKVFLRVNGIEYSFGFDTGFSGQIIFSDTSEDSQIAELETKAVRYGQMFQVPGGEIVNDTLEIKNAKKVFLNDSCYVENSDIILSDKIMENLIGIKFIKNYNWLIDYKERAIYIQQRKTVITENINYPLKYLGVTFNFNANLTTVKTLTMGGRAEKAGLNIGDDILSINNVDISRIPECERNEKIQKILEHASENIFTVRRDDKTKTMIIQSN